VVLSFEPGERVPLLLLGVRDEVTDRPWLPPARHWPGSPLVGGLDEQAGGTWLAVDPDVPRVACLLNGRGTEAEPDRRRSRGELPLRAAADGAGLLKELADDRTALAAYDPFHLICADTGAVRLLSWDGDRAAVRDLEPGTHVLTNAGHAYPAAPGEPVTEPKAVYFGPKFAAARPSADPALPGGNGGARGDGGREPLMPEVSSPMRRKAVGEAWGDWLTYAAGDGLDPADPRAIIARRDLPDGRVWGTTSLSLVALGADGLRYDFRAYPETTTDWYPVIVAV
jgi:Transport and Golgi organisation 2